MLLLSRLKANLLYLITLSLLAYIFYTANRDKAYPTGVFKTATVLSLVPKHSKYSLKTIMTLRTEDGVETVRVVNSGSGFRVGQVIELQEFKSKKRGIKKYTIVR